MKMLNGGHSALKASVHTVTQTLPVDKDHVARSKYGTNGSSAMGYIPAKATNLDEGHNIKTFRRQFFTSLSPRMTGWFGHHCPQ